MQSGPKFFGKQPEQLEQPKAFDVIHSKLCNLHEQLVQTCGQLNAALDRTMPTPTASTDASKPPAANGHFNKLESVVSDFEATLGWLHDIANRLDRIA